MGLFDPNATLSEEPAALYVCRSLLSACPAMHELLDVTSDAAALALIYPGPFAPPEDGQDFTTEELFKTLAYAQLYPPDDVDSLLVSRSMAVGATSEKEGIFRLQLRRNIREAEYNATNGRWDVYMYFLDCTSRVAEELVEAADLNLAVSQVKRLGAPLFNPSTDCPQQGKFLWVNFDIRWGGSEHAE